MNRVSNQQQQLLWRPSEEVLHLLTECRPAQPLWSNEVSPSPSVVEPPKIRQAPAVWKPPSAMKAIVPRPPQPALDEWQQQPTIGEDDPKSESVSAVEDGHQERLPSPATAFQNCSMRAGTSSAELRGDEESGGTMVPPPRPSEEFRQLQQHQQQVFGAPSSSLPPPQQAPSRFFFGANMTKQSLGSMKPPQVPHTPLFSELDDLAKQKSESQTPRFSRLETAAASAKQNSGSNQPQTPLFSGLGTTSSAVAKQVPQTPLFSGLGTSPSSVATSSTDLVKQNPGLKQPQVAKAPLFSGLGTVSFSSGGNNNTSAPQQVAQTPLFSGLGTVSFTSPATFSPPQPSFFAQSPGFGGVQEVSGTTGQQQQQQQQQQPQCDFKMSSTTSASEKGSSTSQACEVPGFRPSELQGKSLLNSNLGDQSLAKAKGKEPKTGTTRRLRTRPMDSLLKPVSNSVPAKAAAAVTRRQAAANLPPVAPKRKKQQQLQQEEEEEEKTVRRAYFAPTGVWIAQKKCTRRAVSKFRRADETMGSGGVATRGASKRRSLTAMSHDRHPLKRSASGVVEKGSEKKVERVPQSSEPRKTLPVVVKKLKSQKAGDRKWVEQKPRKQVQQEKTVEKKKVKQQKRLSAKHQEKTRLDKFRSVHETMRVVVASKPEEHEPQQLSKGVLENDKDDDDDEETDEDVGVAAAVATTAVQGVAQAAEPLIRSKRGRSQVLPTRLRDSVINKVKKRSRKQ